MDRTAKARIQAAAKGFAAGAILMYLFDPDRGKRRRAGLRDSAVGTWHDLTTQCDKAARDFSNRTQGVVAGLKDVITPPDRGVLVERIRSRLGRVVSHPHAISVIAEDGHVILEGPIRDYEEARLLRVVRTMPGVRDVVNHLEVHETSDHISSLQGGTPRIGRSELMQESWTPALRATAGGLGTILLASGLRKGGITRWAGSVAGVALLARAVSNKEFGQIVGVGHSSPLIQFDKALHIAAPVEEVYSFWADYTNFPRFMTHLKAVRDSGDGKSRWIAEGPGGISISWEAEITQQVPNKLLAWRSLPGSQVETAGRVRFDKNAKGGTYVGIHLSYSPPAGMLGHLVASLFGASPKQEIDDDMVRLKSFLETGKTRAHGVTVTRTGMARAATTS